MVYDPGATPLDSSIGYLARDNVMSGKSERRLLMPLKRVSLVPVFVLSSLLVGGVEASAPYEREVEFAEMRYRGGDRLSVACDQAGCVVRARVDRHRFMFLFSPDESRSNLIPRKLILYSGGHVKGSFSFEVETDCSAFVEHTVPHYCLAYFRIEDGKIVDVNEMQVSMGRTINAFSALR